MMTKKLKWKIYEFVVEDGMLNLSKPEYYEGKDIGNRKPTLADMKTVVADYYDLPNRVVLVSKEEAIEIRRNFTPSEQVRILGKTVETANKDIRQGNKDE